MFFLSHKIISGDGGICVTSITFLCSYSLGTSPPLLADIREGVGILGSHQSASYRGGTV